MLLTSGFGVGVGVATLALYAAALASAVPRPTFPPLRAVAQAAWRASGGLGTGDVAEPERRLAGDGVAPSEGWSEEARARAQRVLEAPSLEARWAVMTSQAAAMPDLRRWLGPPADAFPGTEGWVARAARVGVGILTLHPDAVVDPDVDLSPEDVDEDALVGLPDDERALVLRHARRVLGAAGAEGWVVCVSGLDALRLLRAMAAVVPARDRVRAVVLLDAPLRGHGDVAGGPWSPSVWSDWLATWFRHERLDVEWLRPVPWLTAARALGALPDDAERARWGAARLPEPGFVGDGGWFRAQEPPTLRVEDLGVFVAEDGDERLWSVLGAVGVLAALAAAG